MKKRLTFYWNVVAVAGASILKIRNKRDLKHKYKFLYIHMYVYVHTYVYTNVKLKIYNHMILKTPLPKKIRN